VRIVHFVLLATAFGLRPASGAETASGPRLLAVLSRDAAEPIAPPAADTATPAARAATLRSREIPPECLDVVESPELVDCWLKHFPRVASAIRWEFVEAGQRRARRWPEWGPSSQAALRQAYAQARAWHDGGMKAWPGATWTDPPINREAPLGERSTATVLDPSTAWAIYTTQVGLSLAAEIGGWVRWSLRTYDEEALADLFDAPERMFTEGRDDAISGETQVRGYSPAGTVTPSHAATTFRFLRDNRLLAETPLDTISNVLEWGRRHLRRTFRVSPPGRADEPERAHHLAFWHYEGKAPLVRILEGTRVDHPQFAREQPQVEHWTRGGAMTTDLLIWILRAANVPVRRAGGADTCGHLSPYFPAEGLYLSDGDDLYDPLLTTASFSARLLLVPASTRSIWFPNVPGAEPWCWNVGRHVIDLNLRLPSEHLVGLHCGDLAAGKGRAESAVRRAFRGLYTLDKLQDSGLWDRLQERVPTSNADACVRLRRGR
jgi:hypothetical protein